MATYEYPAALLDEINRLRVEKQVRAVDELADAVWAAWSSGAVVEPLGIAAVCQVAFISARDAREKGSESIFAKAQLWRARACAAAVQTGELNTMAMLMIPLAFQASGLGQHTSAVAIVAEMGYLVDEFERREEAREAACHRDGSEFRRSPGVPLAVLRRAQHEKAAYLFWRQCNYVESLAAYRRARPFAAADTRDAIRLDGGELLAQLGIEEEATGEFNVADASVAFRVLADAASTGAWLDVKGPLRRNAEALAARRISTVQDLETVEIE